MRYPSLLALLIALYPILVIASPRLSIRTDAPEDEEREQEPEEPPKPSETKYFHEPGGDDIMGHYDTRFFHGVVSYDERTDTLTHMIRAYLGFFRENNLETWIAHGTLLGWWWNGKVGRVIREFLVLSSDILSRRCYPGTGTSIPRFPNKLCCTWETTSTRR